MEQQPIPQLPSFRFRRGENTEKFNDTVRRTAVDLGASLDLSGDLLTELLFDLAGRFNRVDVDLQSLAEGEGEQVILKFSPQSKPGEGNGIKVTIQSEHMK